MIKITSKKEGVFFRCGIGHTKNPVEYPDARFTAEQLAVLNAEPMLIVEKIKAPAAGEEATDAEAKEAAKEPVSATKGSKGPAKADKKGKQ